MKRYLFLVPAVAMSIAGVMWWKTPRVHNLIGDVCVAQVDVDDVVMVGDFRTPAKWRLEQRTFPDRVFLADWSPDESDRAMIFCRALRQGGLQNAKMTLVWRKSHEWSGDAGTVVEIDRIDTVN